MTDFLPPDIERLRTNLDAVLVPAGFAAAQGSATGGPGHTGGIVWCAPVEDFADRYPHLPPDRGEIIAAGGVCVDVTVEVFNASGSWRTTGLRLEGQDLWDVLAGSGYADHAARAQALIDIEVDACASQLPALLATMFSSGPRSGQAS